MKYAMNHPWKFKSWSQAFRVGLLQMTVVLGLEIVKITFMLTNQTISDIIKDFLALVIISDFDDYFYATVTFSPNAKLI